MFLAKLLAVLFCIILVFIPIFPGAKWNYEFPGDNFKQCGETFPSPIAIRHGCTIPTKFPRWVINEEGNKQKEVLIVNNGNTIELKYLDEKNPIIISGGGLEGEYVFHDVHFHWESEHMINGKSYPLEGHFMFFAKKYGTFKAALNHPDGIAAFGILYEMSLIPTLILMPIAQEVKEVAFSPHKPLLLQTPVMFRSFFPKNLSQYYRYVGSMGTPNCKEGVIWTIFLHPSPVTKTILNEIRTIYDEKDQLVTRNNRPLQKTLGREVLFGYVDHRYKAV